MRITKALIPAVLVAGMAAVSLSGCVQASVGDTNSSSNPTNENLSDMPREVPYLPDSVIKKSTTSGSDATGDYVIDLETSSTDAVKDAEDILKRGGFTEAGVNRWENDKYEVTVTGSGSKVKYQLDRK
ncbi:hypothetical protein [Leifsonia sp. 22587]|uniref:hypothetical protein n=1 Tax=Leifsonia sp. 22587 TaxID=3453946 RepID=UPI003F8578B7